MIPNGVLSRCSLFDGIAHEELDALLFCLGAFYKTYEREEYIFTAGELANFVGVVCSGGAHILKEDIFGNRTIITALSSGDIFGEAFACARTQRLPVSVATVGKSEILFIDYRKIVTSCPKSCGFHSRLIENMLGIVAAKNIALNQKIELISHRTTRDKLMAYLSGEAQRCGSTHFTIPFNRQELADYLCVERSAMSAELSRMSRDGLIKTEKRDFTLLVKGRDL